MDIIIDIGNTNIKIGYFEDNKIKNTIRFCNKEINKIQLPKISKKINNIYIGSVAPSCNLKVIKKFYNFYKIKPVILSTKMFTKHFSLAKFDLNEIGIDILGYALFIKKTCKKGLGISFGTATFSFLVNNKNLIGVMIAPSIFQGIENLNKITELTKTKGFNKNVNILNNFDFGNNTSDALISGANHMTKGFIDSTILFCKKKYKITKCFVAGGKTSFLHFLSNKEYEKKITVVQDPTLIGYSFLIKNLKN